MSFPGYLNKNPNPWEMRHTDAGRLITLSSALLGITATFADGFVDGNARYVLMVGWGALIVSIVFSIFASGKAIKETQAQSQGGGGSGTGGLLNGAFWSLLVGGVLIAGAGGWTMLSKEADLATIREGASSAVSQAMQVEAEELLLSELQVRDDTYELIFSAADSDDQFVALLTRSGEVQSIERGTP